MENYINKRQVFKIQRPLSDLTSPYMVYNEDCSVYFELNSLDDRLEIYKLMGNDPKVYVRGYINEDHKFIIEGKVSKKKW